ncbi:MAG: hypothetical protein OXH24_04170, partial [Cyanobacteria bacterium MAG IRC3_bin_20]|nr:hypothetical protein [Cyanobacteria bacterium MAG IRC3_bin_20]
LEQGINPLHPLQTEPQQEVLQAPYGWEPFAKLKDWRPSATRYHRRAPIFLSAVLLGATLTFWFSGLNLGSVDC